MPLVITSMPAGVEKLASVPKPSAQAADPDPANLVVKPAQKKY